MTVLEIVGGTGDVELCPRGRHPMTPDNVYVWEGTTRSGQYRTIRRCKACRREATRRYETKMRIRAVLPRYDELDVAILRLLPDSGAKKGKYLWDARTARSLMKELDDPYVTAQQVGRHLATLRDDGLVVAVAGKTKSGFTWQRTKEGKRVADGGEPKRRTEGGT